MANRAVNVGLQALHLDLPVTGSCVRNTKTRHQVSFLVMIQC